MIRDDHGASRKQGGEIWKRGLLPGKKCRLRAKDRSVCTPEISKRIRQTKILEGGEKQRVREGSSIEGDNRFPDILLHFVTDVRGDGVEGHLVGEQRNEESVDDANSLVKVRTSEQGSKGVQPGQKTSVDGKEDRVRVHILAKGNPKVRSRHRNQDLKEMTE